MADIDINITDNSGIILQNAFLAKARALEMIGLQAERYAKEGCPVDTGRLRSSITHATQSMAGKTYSFKYNAVGKQAAKAGGFTKQQLAMQVTETAQIGAGITDSEVVIGTNVPYAWKQETNESYHHTVGGAHFLKNAAGNHSNTYCKIIEMAYKGQK